jgi:chitin-binding protein
MINNPGDDDDCQCENPSPGNTTEFDFIYPENLSEYNEGNVVKANDDNLYECRPFPNSGWCSGDSFFYEPGSGLAWKDAWIKIN